MEYSSNYQRRDERVVDYQEFRLPGTHYRVRGPKPKLAPGQYFVCAGAAQTFGCLCEHPYPALLSQDLGLPVLNLGFGGATPGFFLSDKQLLSHINNACFAVIQIMSARSMANSAFRNAGLSYVTRRSDDRSLAADEVWSSIFKEQSVLAVPFGRQLLYLPRLWSSGVARLISESRESWKRSMRDLLGSISVPIILFHFSKNDPAYKDRYWYPGSPLNQFPHLVNREMIEEVKPNAYTYVECITRRGSPQPLVDRYTGKPTAIDLSQDRPDLTGNWRKNPYYPSPEMHEDAARSLRSACRSVLRVSSKHAVTSEAQ